MPFAEDQHAVEQLTAQGADEPLAFMRGAWTAVRRILVPMAWKTAPDEAVKFGLRSRIRNLMRSSRSSRSRARLRLLHGPFARRAGGDPVGFQNSAAVPDLGSYAARSYSLMRPAGLLVNEDRARRPAFCIGKAALTSAHHASTCFGWESTRITGAFPASHRSRSR